MTRPIVLLLSCLVFSLVAGAAESRAGQTVRLGGKVEISEPVQGSAIAAGGHVRLNAPVAASARMAGGRVEVGRDAVVGEDASVAGGSVDVNGTITRNLHAAGGHVSIDGAVGGDVSVAAGKLDLGPNARIGGKLTFHGGELNRDAAAQIAGAVEHNRGRMHTREYGVGERFMRGWIWTLGLVLLAAIIAGALPGPTARLAGELRARPWTALLLGVLAITSIPIAAVLIMVTIIGIPIGLIALLGYAVLLLVGYVWLTVVLGGLLLERFSAETATRTAWRVGAAVLAMLALALLVRVPIAGTLVKFVALAGGVGMIVAAIYHRTARPTATAA